MPKTELERWIQQLLFAQLQAAGLFDRPRFAFAELPIGGPAYHRPWMERTLSYLVDAGELTLEDGRYSLIPRERPAHDDLWTRWSQFRQTLADDVFQNAQLRLIEVMLRALPQILTGQTPATDVMFPNSSMSLVEGVYTGNPVADYFNDVVAHTVVAAVQDRLEEDPRARIRIMEVGAGTGGTTTRVLKQLQPYAAHVATYTYSDLSHAFLMHADTHYAPANPFLQTALFDLEHHPAAQNLTPASYDLVLATNVLHATKNIRHTLQHVKAALKPGGLLILNEICNHSLFGHLTFGLLKGWWLFEDAELRIPGSPALYPESWQNVLEDEGFAQVLFPVEDAHELGQQVVIAESDGRIRAYTPPVKQSKTRTVAPQYGTVSKAGLLAKIRQTIVTNIAGSLKMAEDDIDLREPFADYGIDSITGVNLVTLINDRLHIDLETTALFDYANVVDLAAHIHQAYGHQLADHESTPQSAQAEPLSTPLNQAEPVPTPGRQPIAVIGMSGRFAQSQSVHDLWRHLTEGRDLVTPANRWDDLDAGAGCYGSFLDGIDLFDPLFFSISGIEATYMDPQQRLFLEEAWRAMEDAGYAGAATRGRQIGVYVGTTVSSYQTLLDQNPPAQAFWGNAASVTPARLSYVLDLQGPAVTIDTACSSSLVAVHTACTALWSGEVEAAVAGGVCIQATASFYQAAGPAGMLSPNGRCHTFDDRANGFVPGEAVGVVILKPLSQALADGDHLYGVIRGSGLNQDGATNGITAPSARSQERVERYVYDTFGINPDTIQMVEAHGTGTILGDPIEYRALTKAFRADTQRVGFCALGSVKTNLGHTLGAAGVTGLIKVLLSLHHKQIPPSLHFETGNQHIRFEGSPFYVNTRLQDWNTDGQVRRAAVSSFGFSGTNAHVVVDEAPPIRRVHAQRSAELIVLSARTAAQLKTQATQLIAHLQAHPNQDVGNTAFTLLQGRKHLDHRLALIVKNHEDMLYQLKAWVRGEAPVGVISGKSSEKNLDEAQRIAAQTALDQIGPDDHALIDPFIAIAKAHVAGHDLCFDPLFPKGYSRLSLPTYPFERQHYWITPKDQPAATPPGTATLHPLVHANTSGLAQTRFTTVFSGQEQCLKDHVVEGGRMLPGVAHMEMARAALSAAEPNRPFKLKNVVWLRPILHSEGPETVHIDLTPGERGVNYRLYTQDATGVQAVYSQGTAVFTDQAAAPTLDLDHLRTQCATGELAPETCYQALTWMGFNYGPSLQCIRRIHVGPDQVLAQIQLPQVADSHFDRFGLHPSLMDASLQAAVGLKIDPAVLQDPKNLNAKRRISPSIPFALKELVFFGELPKTLWVWIRMTGDPNAENRPLDLDLCDDQGRVCARLTGFTSRPLTAAQPAPAQLDADPDAGLLWLEPEWVDGDPQSTVTADTDYGARMVMTLDVQAPAPAAGQTHAELVPVQNEAERVHSPARFTQAVAQAIGHIQTLIRSGPDGRALVQLVVSETRTEEHRLFAGLFGLLQTARLEHAKVVTQLILVDGDPDPQTLAGYLAQSARYPDQVIIRYRNGHRRIHRWRETTPPAPAAPPWREGGVYLITGGLGGLGLIFAREIAARIQNGTIVLLGRSPLTEEKRATVAAVPGAVYRNLDVADAAQVKALIDDLTRQYGRINGILHGAGVIFDRYLIDKPAEEVGMVLAPKVDGTYHLDAATAHLDLDFFVLFSSMAGGIGNTGQCDYASANAWMGAFAYHRRDLAARGLRSGQTLTVDWPLWQDGGMTLEAATIDRMRKVLGMYPMTTSAGVRALYQIFAADQPRLMVIEGHLPRLRGNFFPDKVVEQPKSAAPDDAKSAGRLRADLEQALTTMVAEQVQVPQAEVDTETEFQKYGFDSILFANLATAVNDAFNLDLMPTIFFEHTTVTRLAEFLAAEHRDDLTQRLNLAPEPQPSPTPQAVASPKTQPQPAAAPAKAERDPIAVIGMSGRFPMADDVDAFWDNLAAGRDCVSEIPLDRWDWRSFYGDPTREANKCNVKWGAFINGVGDFDPLFFGIAPREAELMDPQQRLLMTYVWLALEDAGYAPKDLAGRSVGILVGTGNSGYGRLMAQGAVDIEVNSTTGMVPSVGPNRMSYLLDLHGPSEPIETACSSSLVAIHRAVLDINAGVAEMAVVGGVNTLITPEAHISFNKAGMLCQDGRCKTFSNRANGFVRGEGVGMIVLKRLSQARADHDHIYGLILGTAVNHGGRAGSLTAPNPKAQAELLKTAWRNAAVDPRTVGYIEAHGTGTELGDPIEIQGLKTAFQALYTEHGRPMPDQPHIGLGSVKTNIGHLELSAGIAGVIKVLLQMKHRTLAPSLHCDTLNPYIQLEHTPFSVVRHKQPWPVLHDDAGAPVPFRAGVSSFGIGGVNAHIVLEAPSEAPVGTDTNTGPALLVLSAANPERLRAYAQKLLSHLRPTANQTSVQTRLIQTLAELLDVDAADIDPQAPFAEYGVDTFKLALLQERLGAESPLALDLDRFLHYQTLTQVAEALKDANFTPTSSAAQPDLRDLAYTLQVGRQALAARFAAEVADLAALETVLTRFLDSPPETRDPAWRCGRAKKGKQGGVAREDVETLVASWLDRGAHAKILDLWVEGYDFDWNRLYPHTKPNRISLPTYPFPATRYWVPTKAVPSAAPQHPMIHRQSTAAGQTRYSAAFTGAESFLADHIMGGQAMLPGVAYLEMVVTAAQQHGLAVSGLQNVTWQRPFIPTEPPTDLHVVLHTDTPQPHFEVVSGDAVSHCSGRILTDAQAEPQTLDLAHLKSGCPISIDGADFYAPFTTGETRLGQSLRAIQQISRNNDLAVARVCLPEAALPGCRLHPAVMDAAFQLTTSLVLQRRMIGRYLPFFLKTLTVYGPTPSRGFVVAQAQPETDPAAGVVRYHVDITDDNGRVLITFEGFTSRDVSLANTVFLKPTRVPAPVLDGQTQPITLVLPAAVTDAQEAALAHHFPSRLRIANIEGPSALFNVAMDLIQARLRTGDTGRLLMLVPGGVDFTNAAPLAALFKTLHQEQRGLSAGLVVIDGLTTLTPERLADLLAAESRDAANHPVAFYDANGTRRVTDLTEVKPAAVTPNDLFRAGGVYWITGGLGGVGRIIAAYLARRPDITLILSGRKSAGPQTDAILQQTFGANPRVHYLAVDVADAQQVQSAVGRITQTHGPLTGLLHCAGLIRDSLIVNKTPAEADAVFAAKVQGLLNLDRATQNQPLDFMVLFSSVAAVFGNAGQADYAAANAWMDAFTRARNADVASGSRSGRTLSINWPLWQEGGMALNPAAVDVMFTRLGLTPLRGSTGAAALFAALGEDEPQLIVLEGDTQKIREVYLQPNAQKGDTQVLKGDTQKGDTQVLKVQKGDTQVLKGDTQNVAAQASVIGGHTQAATRDLLKRFASKMMKIPANQLQDDVDLVDYGFDSITMTDFANKLAIEYQLDLTITDVFEHGTIEKLAIYLLREFPTVFAGTIATTSATPTSQNADQPEKWVSQNSGAPEKWVSQNGGEPEKWVSQNGGEPEKWVSQNSDQSEKRVSQNVGAHEKWVSQNGGEPEKWVSQNAGQSEKWVSQNAGAPEKWVSQNAGAPEKWVSHDQDLAVIGMSARFPMAADINAFWDNLKVGRDCTQEIPDERWDWRHFYGDPKDHKTHINRAGFMDGVGDFDPLFFKISPREAELMDPQQRLLLTHVWWALEDAAVTPKTLSQSPTGVFIACAGVSEYGNMVAASPNSGAALGGAATTFLPGRISHAFNFTGPSEYCDTACSSALTALHRARRALLDDECRHAVLGAVNLLLSPAAFVGFEAMGFLSLGGRARSFQAEADGYVRSEGVGALLLKTREAAQRDGDRILALIKGTGVAHGGRGVSLTAANAVGMKAAMNQAFTAANVDPRTIAYIEAHGIATPLADSVELNAIKSGYRDLESRFPAEVPQEATCHIGSLKPCIGHGELVSGLAALIKTIAALQHQTLPGLPGFSQLHPNLNLTKTRFAVQAESRPWQAMTDADGQTIPRRAAINSYGFSGVNAHVILEEAPAVTTGPADTAEHLVVLSARKPEDLKRQAAALAEFLKREPQIRLADVAYTLQVGREPMPERLAVWTADTAQLTDVLPAFSRDEATSPNLIHGSVGAGGHTAALVAQDEDFAEMTAHWFAKRKLAKLAALWVDGASLDWNRLHGVDRPRRIGLPGYPFAQKRFWAAARPCAAVAKPAKPAAHPLLQRQSRHGQSSVWTTAFNSQSFYLKDHVVHGQHYLPGVVYLEMVRAAVAAGHHGAVQLEHHQWVNPFLLDTQNRDLHLALTPQTDPNRMTYRAYSATTEGETVHAQGVVVLSTKTATGEDLNAVLNQPIQGHLDIQQLYRAFETMGIHYGPSMRGLVEVRYQGDRVSARLQAPMAAQDAALCLHPGQMDAALQAAFALNPGVRDQTDLAALAAGMTHFHAAGMDAVEIYGPCTHHMWVVASSSPSGVDLDLFHLDGSLRVAIRGLRAAAPRHAPHPTTPAAPAVIHQLQLQNPRQATLIDAALTRFHKVYTPQSETLIFKLMLRYLETLGLFQDSKRVINDLKARNGKDYFYDRWLVKSIAFLEEAGMLAPQGNGYRITLPQHEDLDHLWTQWEAHQADWSQNPNAAGYTTLMGSMLKALPQIIRGEKPSTDVLFPNSSMELMANTFRGNFIADLFNEILYDTLEDYFKQRLAVEPDARIRILEIGAGSGGATEGLLERLQPYRDHIAEYCFTDLSKAFLKRAQRRYGKANPFLTTALFDCAKPVAAQGLNEQSYDLILAANVLHATGDIRQTLDITRTAMRPGGMLCLIEICRTYVGAHLTFGMMEGWWLYQDEELRVPGSPALDQTTWERVLNQSGFDRVVFPGVASHELGQQVVIAQVAPSPIPRDRAPLPPAPKALATAQPQAVPASCLTEKVINHMSACLMLAREEIHPDGEFADLGLDSITGVQLIDALNADLGIELVTTCLFEHQTLNQLVTHIQDRFGDRFPTQASTAPNDAQLRDLITALIRDALMIDDEEIQPDGAFEDIGLDSITGVQLIDQLNQRLQTQLVTTCLFEHHTVNRLVAHLRDNLPNGAVPPAQPPQIQVAAPPQSKGAPLSEGQKGLWSLQQMFPEMSAYNCPFAFRVYMAMDPHHLQRACDDLLSHHPILTSVFREEADGPVQIQRPHWRLSLDTRDVSHLDHQQIVALIREESRIPFNLETGPLLRFYLLQVSSDQSILLLNIHHIIFDGTTSFLVFKHLWRAYQAYARGQVPVTPGARTDYADFVAWERAMMTGPEGEAHLAFWRDKLAYIPPPLILPTDHPRGAQTTFTGDTFRTALASETALPLKAWARRHKVNLSCVFLGVFNLLLARYADQNDMLIGLPTKGRPERRFQDCMGYFINLMVIRATMDETRTFPDLLQDLQREVNQSLPHAVYPYPALVRDLARHGENTRDALFQVTFNYQNLIRPANTTPEGDAALPCEVFDDIHQAGDHEFGFEIFELEERFLLHVHYRDDLFHAATIAKMMAHTLRLIHEILADDTRPIHQLTMLDEDEHRTILEVWGRGEVAEAESAPAHQWIQDQAQAHPDAVALEGSGDAPVTYAQLNQCANQWAACLLERGLQRGQTVGLCLDRKPHAVTLLIAVLKAGGVAVPLDPGAPHATHEHMAADAGLRFILLDDVTAPRTPFDADRDERVLVFDQTDVTAFSPENLDRAIAPEQPAYIIYTSGSTGTPKGVVVSHGACANHTRTIGDYYQVKPTDTVLQFASHHVDTALEQIFSCLCFGGRLVLRGDELWSPRAFSRFLSDKQLNIIDIPPRYLHELLLAWRRDPQNPPYTGLTRVIVGGEAVLPETAALWRELDLQAVLINAYGPTETTVTSVLHGLEPQDKDGPNLLPIGRPAAGEQALILDPRGRLVPEGVPGELHIGGRCLAQGYLNRPDLTAARFIPNPFAQTPGERLYQTGDLARYLPGRKGMIAFLGRRDHQVKIRGFRVELGEIETRLTQLDGVLEAVVLLHQAEGAEPILAAYLKSDGRQLDGAALKRILRDKMPAHMIPQTFIPIASWPLTPSGKVDRRALPAPVADLDGARHRASPPRDALEQRLAEIWSRVLNVPRVGVYDNFFELGGHSLLCVRLLAAIEREYGRRLTVASLITTPYVAGQAALLREEADLPGSLLVGLRVGGDKAPFFCVHPVGGSVFGYRELAALTQAGRPFYGLQHPALDGGEPFETIEEAAATYIEALRRFQPKGPYHLGGWSMGGVIAFEMARQLRDAGETTAYLALFDSVTPELVRQLEAQHAMEGVADETRLLLAFAHDLFDGSLSSTQIDPPMQADALLRWIGDQAVEAGLVDVRDTHWLEARYTIFKAGIRALNAYQPQAYDGDLALFRARDSRASAGDPTGGWGQWVRGDLLIRNVDGDHYSMLAEPHVVPLAKTFNHSFPGGGLDRENYK